MSKNSKSLNDLDVKQLEYIDMDMDFNIIGQKIKELRKVLGLTQKDLAKGICTQAQISKVESGEVYPFAKTLYQISQRLGVDVNYFFNIGETPRLDYVNEVNRQLRIARRNLDYIEMKQIVENEEDNPVFTQNRKNLQLLLWHKGIYEFQLNKKMELSLDLLDKAISLTHSKHWSEREIEILLCKGVIYFEQGMLKEALEIYQPANEFAKVLPHIQDHSIISRLNYNTARTLTRLNEYYFSIKTCKDAIDYCIEHDNLYLLGELHYHIGYNYELLGQLDSVKSYLESSLIIFELQKDTKYIEFIKEKLMKYENNI